jgi:hypothetical protein
MIPLSDDVPSRRFPWVNLGPILANFVVFLVYELPNPNGVTDWSCTRAPPRAPALPPSRGGSPG